MQGLKFQTTFESEDVDYENFTSEFNSKKRDKDRDYDREDFREELEDEDSHDSSGESPDLSSLQDLELTQLDIDKALQVANFDTDKLSQTINMGFDAINIFAKLEKEVSKVVIAAKEGQLDAIPQKMEEEILP